MASRPPERDELDLMLEPLIEFAQNMLRKHGEFYPFANSMRNDGQITMVGGYTGDEHPASNEVIEVLVGALRAQAETGEIKASGLCFDARLRGTDGKPTDAIAISLEHREGDCVMVAMPYSKGRFSGLSFGQLVAGPPPPRRVFVGG